MSWRAYLILSDPDFERDCRLTHTRGSGPGGQKRNKTSSAVRIDHLPTGLSVRAEEERSQLANRKRAIARLRWTIALSLRAPPASANLDRLNPRIPTDAAAVLDVLHAHEYALAPAALQMGATTGALSAFLCDNDLLLTHVNQRRAQCGLKPLRSR
jgi:hypothetical protein